MKVWKIFLSVGIIVLVIGVIVFITGLGMNGWKFQVEYDMRTFNAQSDNTNLDLSLSAGRMNVEFYDGDKIEVEYPDAYQYGYEVYENDGCVYVTPKTTFFIWFGWNKIPDVTVKIPKDAKMYLTLKVSAGTANIAEGVFKGANFKLSAGKIIAEGLNCDYIEETGWADGAFRAEISAGYLSVDKLQAREINLSLSAGSADIRCQNNEKVKAHVSAGSLSMRLAGAKSEYDISVDKSAGSCNVSSQRRSGGLQRTLDIDLSAGSVNAYFGLS
ncbi:MAG: DUF4097 domain-containing protein [Roseburia sp.]|nr:DUF4097 domain-containing protein [Roseburia sp.]